MSGRGTIDVRRAGSRFHTVADWLDSWHSFSFGRHYDPDDTGHGLLLVHNDDRVAPARGFPPHPHRDMEIVTWVLEGRLEHRDSAGHHGIIYPGLAQRMSAGTGIRHSETNPDPDRPVHFLQMWVPPDTPGLEPGYEQVDVSDALATGAWVVVASGGEHDTGTHLHQRDATLRAARPAVGASLAVPEAPHVHVFVARGAVSVDGHRLAEGDAARLTGYGDGEIATAAADTEVLAWATA